MNLEHKSVQSREYKYDNFRFFLIFIVVFGHGIELFADPAAMVIYRLIYSFHMPAFLFITGKFAKFEKKKIIQRLIIPYLIFQTLYLLFNNCLLIDHMPIQYTTPYWLVWYLLAAAIYYLLIPMFPAKGSRYCFVVFVGSLIASLLVGYDDSIGTYMTLSRVFVFGPFFFLGYYDTEIYAVISTWLKKQKVRFSKKGICILFICVGEFYILYMHVPVVLLYGRESYGSCGSSIIERGIVLMTAFAWIELFCTLVPERRIPIISDYGQRTMPIYLLHGFVIRLLGKYEVFHFSTAVNLLILFVIAIVSVLALGNKYLNWLFVYHPVIPCNRIRNKSGDP